MKWKWKCTFPYFHKCYRTLLYFTKIRPDFTCVNKLKVQFITITEGRKSIYFLKKGIFRNLKTCIPEYLYLLNWHIISECKMFLILKKKCIFQLNQLPFYCNKSSLFAKYEKLRLLLLICGTRSVDHLLSRLFTRGLSSIFMIMTQKTFSSYLVGFCSSK